MKPTNNIRLKLKPVCDRDEIQRLSALEQFREIENATLFRIVLVGTGFIATDRWAAIRIIVVRGCPIPVPPRYGRV